MDILKSYQWGQTQELIGCTRPSSIYRYTQGITSSSEFYKIPIIVMTQSCQSITWHHCVSRVDRRTPDCPWVFSSVCSPAADMAHWIRHLQALPIWTWACWPYFKSCFTLVSTADHICTLNPDSPVAGSPQHQLLPYSWLGLAHQYRCYMHFFCQPASETSGCLL